MKGKIVDTDESIHTGGRADRYWKSRSMKENRSSTAKSQEYTMSNVEVMRIRDKYHLKGFEFGNWVTSEERVDYMLAVDSALSSLAKTMHTKNLGMDGIVGVAFGARGGGNFAAAHYEPCLNMINLTKTKGDHSLAHEFFHSIDYNFGRFVDQNKDYSALTGGDLTSQRLLGNEGAQFRYYANMIVDYIKTTRSYHRLDSVKSAYWHRRNEIFARWGEQYCAYKNYNTFLCKTTAYYNSASKFQYLSMQDFLPTVTMGDKLCAAVGAYLERRSTKLTPMKYHKDDHVDKRTHTLRKPTTKK